MTDSAGKVRQDATTWLISCLTLAVQAEDANRAGDKEMAQFFSEAVAAAIVSVRLDDAHILMGLMVEALTGQFYDREEVRESDQAGHR